MARTYKRDSRGRFAGGGGGGGGKKGGRKKAAAKTKGPRKSDLAFQKSGKGGGTSVKAGRAAKAAYKAKEGARRKTAYAKKKENKTGFLATPDFKGSQARKKGMAKRAAKGTGYQRTRKKK